MVGGSRSIFGLVFCGITGSTASSRLSTMATTAPVTPPPPTGIFKRPMSPTKNHDYMYSKAWKKNLWKSIDAVDNAVQELSSEDFVFAMWQLFQESSDQFDRWLIDLS